MYEENSWTLLINTTITKENGGSLIVTLHSDSYSYIPLHYEKKYLNLNFIALKRTQKNSWTHDLADFVRFVVFPQIASEI